MDSPAEFQVRQDNGTETASLSGDWTAVNMGDAGVRLKNALLDSKQARLDLSQIGRCDTAGAFAILRASEDRVAPDAITAPLGTGRLIDLVRHALKADPVPHTPARPFY